jgi:hypothetical protein
VSKSVNQYSPAPVVKTKPTRKQTRQADPRNINQKIFEVTMVCFKSGEIQQKLFPQFENVFHVYLMRVLQKYAKN